MITSPITMTTRVKHQLAHEPEQPLYNVEPVSEAHPQRSQAASLTRRYSVRNSSR